MSSQSAGGRVTAVKLRQQALATYYQNPNRCLKCDLIIDVADNQKVSEVRRRKFCNKSCSAGYHNALNPKRIKQIKPKEAKKPRVNPVMTRTKGEQFSACKNWQSARSGIQKAARKVLLESGLYPDCDVCSYAAHVEVCHIKPVHQFTDDTLVSTINAVKNLMFLCPNHHWEYDNGLLR